MSQWIRAQDLRVRNTRAQKSSRVDGNRINQKRAAEISYRTSSMLSKGYESFTKDLKGGEMRKRIFVMFILVAGVLSALGLRVALLQTVWAGDYRQASVSQRTRVVILRAERGSILDRNGRELALPVPTRTVFADPRSVLDPVGTARAVAGILQLTPQAEVELAAKLQDKTSSFVYIARQADQEVSNTILALGLKGISSYRESGRALTSAGLRALVGRTDVDGVGISGLELKYQDILTGTDGRIVREVNSGGQSIATGASEVTEAVSGGRLVTTIDRTIQFQVDGILTQQVERLGARGGTALVMDSKTGEIYAMSNVRRNEDGTYSSDSGNFATVEAYEPGSVAKVFTIAAAMNEGTVDPTTSFKVPGVQVFDRGTQWEYKVTDAYPHGLEDMSVRKIIVDSSNLGTVLISRTLDSAKNHGYLKAFGFGTKTAVDYPGETRGLLKSVKKWQGTEKITFAYGYGYTATALQLIAAVNVVANDGIYVAPKLVASTVDAKGIETSTAPSATHNVISSATAKTMTSLLTDVVCYGTGQLAKLPGMSVAGKTGTAYKLQDNGTYIKDDGSRVYFASFVGFLPANNPRMTVLVSIDEPDPSTRDRFGGTAAAPVFARIGQVLINELDIRPEPGGAGCVGTRPAELGPGH